MRSRKEPRPAGVINPGLEPIPILTPTTPTPATNEQVKRSVKLRISDSSGQVKRNGGKHRSSSVQIKKESKASVGTVQAQLAEKKSSLSGAFIAVFDGLSLDSYDLLCHFKSKYIKSVHEICQYAFNPWHIKYSRFW